MIQLYRWVPDRLEYMREDRAAAWTMIRLFEHLGAEIRRVRLISLRLGEAV